MDWNIVSFTDKELCEMRKGAVTRNTKETEIFCSVNLDGIGISKISTGIGFFDHMLELLCHHSLVDIDIVVKGDTHVDMHHTVEDAGYALAQSIIIALGNKEGITLHTVLKNVKAEFTMLKTN